MIQMLSENQSSIDHVHGPGFEIWYTTHRLRRSLGFRRGPRLDIVAFHGSAIV